MRRMARAGSRVSRACWRASACADSMSTSATPPACAVPTVITLSERRRRLSRLRSALRSRPSRWMARRKGQSRPTSGSSQPGSVSSGGASRKSERESRPGPPRLPPTRRLVGRLVHRDVAQAALQPPGRDRPRRRGAGPPSPSQRAKRRRSARRARRRRAVATRERVRDPPSSSWPMPNASSGGQGSSAGCRPSHSTRSAAARDEPPHPQVHPLEVAADLVHRLLQAAAGQVRRALPCRAAWRPPSSPRGGAGETTR